MQEPTSISSTNTPEGSASGPVGGHPAAKQARPSLSFPEPVINVIAWDDPLVEAAGHHPCAPYVERFWAPILGPSCLMLARRLAFALDEHPEGFEMVTTEWAAELGLTVRGGKNGPFWKALDRSARFGVAKRNGSTLQVRRKISPLTIRQVERLPTHLQRSHHAFAERERQTALIKASERAAQRTHPAAQQFPLDAA